MIGKREHRSTRADELSGVAGSARAPCPDSIKSCPRALCSRREADGLSKFRLKLPSRARCFRKKRRKNGGSHCLSLYAGRNLVSRSSLFLSHLPVDDESRLFFFAVSLLCAPSRFAVSHARIKMYVQYEGALRGPTEPPKGAVFQDGLLHFLPRRFRTSMIYSNGRGYLGNPCISRLRTFARHTTQERTTAINVPYQWRLASRDYFNYSWQ